MVLQRDPDLVFWRESRVGVLHVPVSVVSLSEEKRQDGFRRLVHPWRRRRVIGDTQTPQIDAQRPWRACLDCRTPAEATRCLDCEAQRPKVKRGERSNPASADRRGYTAAWRRLARSAIALQPWCSACHSPEDLTGDHLRWPARSLDDVDVLCRSCNSSKGAIRSLSSSVSAKPTETHGGRGKGTTATRRREGDSQILSPPEERSR